MNSTELPFVVTAETLVLGILEPVEIENTTVISNLDQVQNYTSPHFRDSENFGTLQTLAGGFAVLSAIILCCACLSRH